MSKPKIINIYAGPGVGKSTTATAVFSELKQLGVNCEYVSEYAKDATWERRGEKVFKAQEYIFGKQHFRLARLHEEVDVIVTDSPILLTNVYMKLNPDFGMPSLAETVREAYCLYDNLDVLLERNKPYNQSGRNQTEDEAKALDVKVREMLNELPQHKGSRTHLELPYGRKAINQIIWEAGRIWRGDIPKLTSFVPSFRPTSTEIGLPASGDHVSIKDGQLAVYYSTDVVYEFENARGLARKLRLAPGWYTVTAEGMFSVEGVKWWMPLISDEDVFA